MRTQSGVAEAFLGGFEQTSSITEEEAQQRIDLLVSPEDEKWNDVLQEFQRLFADPDMTIGRILSDKFTTHEARLFIPSELAILKAIQEENTRDFHDLLESRFQGVTPDIPTKLTMLYFGLHVEPMDFQLAKMTFKMESRKPEPPRYAIDPPLHFLTAHKERNWGKDMLRGKEDSSYPIPVELPQSWLSSLSNTFLTEQDSQIEQPTVRLRGGGTSEDSDWRKHNDDWNGGDDDDFAGSESNGEDGNEDSDDEDDTPEAQLHREEKEAEDATMENTDNDGNFISPRQSAIIPQSSIGMNLYGFQGFVPFIPGDGQTYENAIRRLLSLGPQDHEAFSIVHFDVQTKTIVNTIQDSLPLNPDSITLQYILEKKLEEDNSRDNQHSFFVHLEHESTPTHWQPSEEELYTSVSSVRSLSDGTEGKVARVVDSCCYLTFPRFNDSQPSQQDVYGWGADQLNAYINTAFEVLFGRPQGSFHHANFQLSGRDLDFTNAPPVYGLYTTPSSGVLSLIPNGEGKHFYLSRSPLGNNNVPIVLPGCFKISNPTSDSFGKIPLTGVLDFMRNIISSAFGDYAKNLKYVRLLDGRATLGPEIRRDQEYHSICMSDDIPQNSKIDYSAALSKIAETKKAFVLLYPEWEEDENVLHLSTSDGEDGAEHSVHMPSLSSTVDDFRTSVFELMQLAECEPSRIEDVKRGDAFISVQPEMENESADIIDMPCFFIGPNTTDEEWFSIRARIPTPSAKINILDSKAWNWRDQVDETNIWGPRYGRMADAQAAIEKPEDKDAREQEEEEAPQNAAEETAQEAVQTPAPESPIGIEAVRARLRETELVKATHPEPAKTQRLGRDASGDSDVRESSWLRQPSLYDNCGSCSQSNYSDIKIPTNAPSFEHQLCTGDKTPRVATRFRTLTEQARLQRALWDMRNIRLNRIPPLMLRKCTFCNGIIPNHWSKERVHRHLRQKHRNELMEALGVTKATIRRFDGKGVISIPLKRVEKRHKPSPVASANDAMIVDQPEAQNHQQKKAFEFCDRCGDDGKNCESDTTHPAQDGRDQNRNSCKGSGVKRGRYCRYCGDEFSGNAGQADWDRNAAHMVACYKKNDGQKSLFLPPDVAAFNQQQDNLRMQINEAEPGALDSHEGEEIPNIEAIHHAINSEAEQDPEEMDLDESDEEPRRPKPTKRVHARRSGEESTDLSMDGTVNISALQAAVNRALTGYETPPTEALDPDAHQEALPTALKRVLANVPLDELDVSSPSMTQSRAPLQPENSDSLATESEKEPEVIQPETREAAESLELQPPESSESEPDNGSDFENEPDQDKSNDEESEDDPHGDPISSKRHKRGGKKRGKKGDRNYTYSHEEDDDEDSETDEDGTRTRLPRRAPSPNWQKKLGDDPEFEPTDDYYCSKCFRKAPKKHKRDRSPLGRTKEIELHYDKNRCCGIRRGIGSTKRLPNRSGWIPSAAMPKPLGNLRKQFLRPYPAYSRTLYPLNVSNANGSYWRSDPNNDDNKGCWDIPWPPFRGPTPLPNGWEAPDAINLPVTGKARKQFKLRAVGDSTYVQDKNVQDSDDEEIASDKDVNGKRKRKSRPSSAVNSRHATPIPGKMPQKPDAKAEKAATPRPVKKKETVVRKMLKGKAARPRKAAPKKTERKEPTRRSARKRQKTG
ncbi:hypothetical protein T069G_03480 [Trichoderma breve]|uniref:Uncharacterized protein n=1 Tax=Trichoderma breve TaxID=2034170 RepID=A0A9W9BMG8_9HYPO|nr:hypothetical protein T069G_03480 [Trichoderma breve]KAJ4862526.1 hypothetical protein T069G_03480 [Trichoderma breve]